MTRLPDTNRARLPLGKRGAFEGVARRHGRRRNPARMTPRSSLRTPTNQPRLHTQRWVEKVGRSIKGSDTPHHLPEPPITHHVSDPVANPSPGEVVLSARLERQDQTSHCITIEVRDTGIGISPDQLPRLFSSFNQADASIRSEEH